jgi:hypothetical protein
LEEQRIIRTRVHGLETSLKRTYDLNFGRGDERKRPERRRTVKKSLRK